MIILNFAHVSSYIYWHTKINKPVLASQPTNFFPTFNSNVWHAEKTTLPPPQPAVMIYSVLTAQ